MKIAVPILKFKNKPAIVHGNLATAPAFYIYDDETGVSEERINPRICDGEAPPNPLTVVRDLKVDVLLCGGCGDWALKLIETAGVKIYLAHGGLVEQAIADYKAGKLMRAVEEHRNDPPPV